MQDFSNPVAANSQMSAASCSRQQCNQELVGMIKEQSICEGLSGMSGRHSCSERLNWIAIMSRLGQTPKPTGLFWPHAVADAFCAVFLLMHGLLRKCVPWTHSVAPHFRVLFCLKVLYPAAVGKRRRLQQKRHPLGSILDISSEQIQHLATLWH